MDKIWARKSFEVGGHWPLWRGCKKRMTTQNRQKSLHIIPMTCRFSWHTFHETRPKSFRVISPFFKILIYIYFHLSVFPFDKMGIGSIQWYFLFSPDVFRYYICKTIKRIIWLTCCNVLSSNGIVQHAVLNCNSSLFYNHCCMF